MANTAEGNTNPIEPRPSFLHCKFDRCCYCSFKLQQGEVVVIDHWTAAGPVRTVHTDGPLELMPAQCLVVSVEQDVQGDFTARGYHKACGEVIPWRRHDAVMEVMRTEWAPSDTEDRRRTEWLRSVLRSKLDAIISAAGLPFLPAEIRDEIASYSDVSDMAHMASRLRPSDRGSKFSVQMRNGLWARYVNLAGVRYLASLSGKRVRGSRRLYSRSLGPADTVYAGMDHLGVRELVFGTGQTAPSICKQPGVWWVAVPLQNTWPMVTGSSDGLKIRRIDEVISPTDNRVRHPEWLWDVPKPPNWTVWESFMGSLTRRFVVQTLPLNRMTSVLFNGPGCTGYSVQWTRWTHQLHAHYPGDDMGFYNEEHTGCPSVWLHFPLAEGEQIDTLWHQNGELPDAYSVSPWDRSTLFIVVTTTGKTGVLGPYADVRYMPHFQLVESMQGRPREVYISESWALRVVGVAPPFSPAPINTLLRPRFPVPSLQRPPSPLHEPFFYSRAELGGVVEFTTCRLKMGDQHVVSGMLLRYSLGGRVALGQVRLDSLDEPRRTSDFETLWLRFSKRVPNITGVSRLQPMTEDPCLEVRWDGWLEWWFSYRQCRLIHGGRKSPPTDGTRQLQRLAAGLFVMGGGE